MISEKQALRGKLKKIRDSIPNSHRIHASRLIARLLFQLKKFKQAKTIALYSNIGSEAQTEFIFKKAMQFRKKVIYPQIVQREKELIFYRVQNIKTDMVPGHFGILQPRPDLKKIPAKKIDLIVVPGIAFDQKGHRLGYGKGYYDNFLKKNSGIFSAGLCYEKTFLRSIPRAQRDQPVHCILTEKKVYYP